MHVLQIFISLKKKKKTLVCTYKIRVDRKVLVRVNEEKNVSNVGLEIQRIWVNM